MDWYEQKIESEVRDLVKLLRNNGFNTVASCGHDLTVNIQSQSEVDLINVIELLNDNIDRYKADYVYRVDKCNCHITKYIVIYLPHSNGLFADEIMNNEYLLLKEQHKS
jgi:hypothetical protein